MLPRHTPPGIRPPFANYAFGVEIPPGARLLVCSGQLGITLDDVIPESAEDQAELIFQALKRVLASAGMSIADVVRFNAYVTDRAHLKAYMTVRDRHVVNPAPASTLMIVSGFANERFLVEVEAIAAKLD